MSYRAHLLAILILIVAPTTFAQELVTVDNIRVSSGSDAIRIVFDLTAPVEYKAFMLTGKDRLVVDLDQAQLAKASLNEASFKEVGMRGVRHSPHTNRVYRIVFDLEKSYKLSAFQIAPNQQYGHRLVIDLHHLDVPTLSQSSSPSSQSTPKQSVSKEEIPELASPAALLEAKPRPFVIVIDPGHGGVDPGAIGPRGTYEKNITLQFSKKLQKRLNARKGVVAHLTRTGDYFIPLATRTQIARQLNADLFISIHTDGAENAKARGASVYALSHRGATSETAKWLAKRENASDLVGGVTLDDKEDTLAYVLLDLSQSATLDASLFLGRGILEQLGRVTTLHSKKVEQAGFLVLRSPDIPSVLVELGYITNHEEERLLKSNAYQEKLLTALDSGVGEFYAQRGSLRYIAMTEPSPHAASGSAPLSSVSLNPAAQQKHLVSRGETLERIAKRYNVTTSALRHLNGLKGDVIYAGSTLQIP